MLPVLLLGLSLFSGDVPAYRTVTHVAGWRVEQLQDRFTGQRECSLHRKKITVSSGFVTFSLGDYADTSNAAVRIDGGPPIYVKRSDETLPSLSRAVLYNPSMGVMRMPLSALNGARNIMVESTPDVPLKRFTLTGLNQALQAAAQARCPGFLP